MKATISLMIFCIFLTSCGAKNSNEETNTPSLPIAGTWQLLTGTVIQNRDTTVTGYTKNNSFIKIINDTHFAFLKHNIAHAKDSSNGFDAGGGRYTLKDSVYTEYLDYCLEKEWEGHEFNFTITINNDTLTQTGIEKIDGAGINRLNIERYVRLKH
jgi:predicted extracellular nuclease